MARIKKKTININFKYFWENFDPENNFYTNLLRKNYNVIISENPNYVFYSVYPNIPVRDVGKIGIFIKKISPNLYIILRRVYPKVMLFLKREKPIPEIKGNFIKIFHASEYVKPDMSKCDWAFAPGFDEGFNHPRGIKLPCFLVNDFNLGEKALPPLKKEIDFNKIKREKTKFCNFIYSQDIPARNNFFKELSKYKRVDSPGRCMNNMPPIGSYKDPKQSRNSKDWVNQKLNFLKNYKFTIAFENFSLSGWTTEKLTHPMLVNSIPIYIGHEDIKRDFNTKSFINFKDFKNMKEFLEYIIKVDKDDKLYEKILKEPWYNNNQLPEDFDLRRIQKKFKEIFG